MRVSKFIYLLLSLAVSCGTSLPSSEKPRILVSIAPYCFFAQRIAGPDFEVSAVVPAASNPHSFEPTAGQVRQMGESVIWLRIGEPFEKKILPILQAHNQDLVITDLRDGVPMLEEAHGCKHCSSDHFDRHIWLSPHLAKMQAALIEKTLSAKYPERHEEFYSNFLKLSRELETLETEIRATLQQSEDRPLLVSHPAFGYFCHDFHLKQLSVEYEGKDPRPKHLDDILKSAVSTEVILALPQHNNHGTILIAKKLGKPVQYIDPYSSDYLTMMKTLANIIATSYAD